MKKITLTFILFCACGVLAYAGPVTAEKNVTPMAPAPECTWTGFYIGVNAGITQFHSDIVDISDWDDNFNGTYSYSSPAFIGGGQLGYNYQWQNLVLGVEADFSGSTAKNSQRVWDGDNDNENYGDSDYAKVDFMMTFRGRLGISFLDNRALLYATAGGAYAHGKWDRYYHDFGETYYEADWRGDDWRWGWVGGFGFEYALNCHWSLRGEGLYTWLEHDTTGISGPAGSGYLDRYGYRYNVRFDDDLWTYRVGVDYKFTGFFGAH